MEKLDNFIAIQFEEFDDFIEFTGTKFDDKYQVSQDMRTVLVSLEDGSDELSMESLVEDIKSLNINIDKVEFSEVFIRPIMIV